MDYLAKILVETFLVVGLGVPSSLLILENGSRYIQRLILASVLLTGLYSYLLFTIITSVASINRTFYTILVALIVIIPFFFRRSRRMLGRIASRLTWNHPRLGLFEITGFSIIIILLLVTFYQGLMSTPILDDPPAVWLLLGKQIYLTGRFPLYYGNAADISWAGNWPPNASFIAAGIFLLSNRVDAFDYGLVPWLYGTFGLLAVWILVRELNGSRKAAVFAVMVTMFTTIYSVEMMGWGYVETIIAFYITAFLAFAFMRSGESRQNGLFASLGLTLALLSKFNALLVLLPSIPLLLLLKPDLCRRTGSGLRGYRTPLFLLAIVSVGVSWYLRNWLLVGDPVYPYLYNYLADRGIVRSIISLIPINHEPVSVLWTDATFSSLMDQGNLWGLIGFGAAGMITPLWAYKGKRLRRLFLLSLWTVVSVGSLVGFMAARGGFERYLVMLVPAIAACAGFLVDQISNVRGDHLAGIVRRAALPCLLLALVVTSPGLAYLLEPPRRPSPEFSVWFSQVNALPSGTFATNDLRLFYFDHPVVQLYNIAALFTANSTFAVWQVLKNNNISYVYFTARFDEQVFRAHTLLLQTFADPTLMTLIYSNDPNFPNVGEGVYRVNP